MLKFNDWPIAVKLLTVFLVLALLPMGIVAWVSYQRAYQGLIELALNELEVETILTGDNVITFMEQFHSDILALSDTPPIQGLIRAQINNGIDPLEETTYEVWRNRLIQIFVAQAGNKKFYQQLRYLNEEGEEVVRVDYRNDQVIVVPISDLQNKADRDYFIESLPLESGEVYISDLNLNREQGEIEVPHVPVIRYSTPVYDSSGNFRGIVISNIYAQVILDRLITNRGAYYLANQDNYYLYHPDPTRTFGFDLGHESNVDDEFQEVHLGLESLVDMGITTYGRFDEARQEFVTLSKIYFDPRNSNRHFLLIKTLPEEDVLGPVSDLGWMVLGIAVVITLIVIIVAYIFTQFFTRQLTQITDLFKAIQTGDLTKRTTITGRDELGQMAEGLNKLLDRLVNLLQTTEAERDHLQNTVVNYVHFAKQVANGDLTVRLTLNGQNNDMLNQLGHNLNEMVKSLSQITSQIRETTANISSVSAELLASTTEQTTGANQQSAAVNQTTATISEVKSIVEQAFARAEEVAQNAQSTRTISQTGQQAITETVSGMHQIKEKVAGIAENILALSEQTQQIGDITTTVNEIASQSNLLALNAAVEAARAGEHGKGFAVVAVEVRNLAEQSRQATAQVKAILDEIQRATNTAVMATEEGTKGVDSGVILTQQAGDTIMQLAQNVTESVNMAQQIVASTQQQITGIEQISLAMQNINQAMAQSLASTRQMERSAQDLSQVAQELELLVARYKL